MYLVYNIQKRPKSDNHFNQNLHKTPRFVFMGEPDCFSHCSKLLIFFCWDLSTKAQVSEYIACEFGDEQTSDQKH